MLWQLLLPYPCERSTGVSHKYSTYDVNSSGFVSGIGHVSKFVFTFYTGTNYTGSSTTRTWYRLLHKTRSINQNMSDLFKSCHEN